MSENVVKYVKCSPEQNAGCLFIIGPLGQKTSNHRQRHGGIEGTSHPNPIPLTLFVVQLVN